MRKGMTFYLGAHTEYQANLLDTFIFNDSAIALRYTHHAKGIHPQNQQEIEYTQTIMDVLEIEDGKIAVTQSPGNLRTIFGSNTDSKNVAAAVANSILPATL